MLFRRDTYKRWEKIPANINQGKFVYLYEY